MPDTKPAPRLVRGVMISSTFTDLEQHRAALIRAIKGEGLTDFAMENDTAKPGVDVIDSSLQMVRDASAYIGLISRKYGQTPPSPDRNPGMLSITEVEFNEALRLERPILLFIMGPEHLIREADVELDPGKREKLDAFRERAKQMRPDSAVHRVYATFSSLEEFTRQASHAVSGLRRYLDEQNSAPLAPEPVTAHAPDPIPSPPALYAEPPYIGSHEFLGRLAELERLNDWASPADAHPVLLFDAIGGSGKSILTWEWTTKPGTQVRTDWAGRFWYSFYGHGAVMSDFCRRALAYITGQSLETFAKRKTLDLAEELLHHLRDRPWLLVLDGLERVLVAYNRFDAAQVADEEANRPTDQIAQRDPCAAIRPEDDDLLRAFAGAAPSKVLISSRLVPRVLLNQASQPIPGVLRVLLQGLRAADAEALLRSSGIRGDSRAIQEYLKSHCDCHPLVTGVLAGLINDYFLDKGNFDAWSTDPSGGGSLNLAELDLTQKRNHILKAALDTVPEKGREVLSTLALLSEAVDSRILAALHAHIPQSELAKIVRDLERRRLIQFDMQTRRYDLHPVVRGIAAGRLQREETERYGQRVVDYFLHQTHKPYDQAETIDDLQSGLLVVRTLLKMGRYKQAYDAYTGALSKALHLNIEANAEILSLLQPFFRGNWATLPSDVDADAGADLANAAGLALAGAEQPEQALAAHGAALAVDRSTANWAGARMVLSNIAAIFQSQNRVSKQAKFLTLALDLATLIGDPKEIFHARINQFRALADRGDWANAEAMWVLLDPLGRDRSRIVYPPEYAEYLYALFRFWRGNLTEDLLTCAEELAQSKRNRIVVRWCHSLRGQWRLQSADWDLAAESLSTAVAMGRAVGRADVTAETELALAKFHLGQLPDPAREAKQLASAGRPSNRPLAELWLAIGEYDTAKTYALVAYRWAWADGEPYVHRYELNKSRTLLEQLGAEIPDLPPYDPAKDEKFPWEDQLVAAIEKLRAEKRSQP
jgi:tetratricopeptide (TPR) repeat protein